MWQKNALQLAYGLFAIFCYFIVFYALFLKRKTLGSSFIAIYVLMAVSNIATWTHTLMCVKFMNEPFFFFYYEWIKDKPLIVNIHFGFLLSHFNYIQNMDQVLLTFDRYESVSAGLGSIKWWRKYWPWIIILAHFLLIPIQLLIRLPISSTLSYDNLTSSYKATSDKTNSAFSSFFQLGFGVVTFTICLILNIRMFIILRQWKNSASKNAQWSLFVLGCLCFLTQTLSLIIVAMITVNSSSNADGLRYTPLINDMVHYCSDLFSLGPAIFTLLIPGLLRQVVLRKIKYLFQLLRHGSAVPQIEPSVLIT